MKELVCDVLIIGASSAGLGASLALADSDLNVVCVDKKTKIGHPVKCAEGIGKFFVDILPVKIPNSLLKWNIKGIAFFKDSLVLKKTGPIWKGYSIDRDKVENFFYKKAKSKKINFLLNTNLKYILKNKSNVVNSLVFKSHDKVIKINPKYVIAADGVDSKVLNLLKVPKKRRIVGEIINYEVKSKNLSLVDYEQIYLGDFAPKGYGFIFPKSKTVANVGVGCIMPKSSMKLAFKKFLCIENVAKQLKDMTILKDKSKTAAFGDQLYKNVFGNVVFCGDAANHNFKPFVEGFLPSFISGYSAGNLIKSGDVSNVNYSLLINEALPGFKDTKNLQSAMLDVFKEKGPLQINHLFLLSSGLVSPENIKKINFNQSNILIKKNCSELKKF
jgi:digeranylgeranylglycerophospholipid reductase